MYCGKRLQDREVVHAFVEVRDEKLIFPLMLFGKKMFTKCTKVGMVFACKRTDNGISYAAKELPEFGIKSKDENGMDVTKGTGFLFGDDLKKFKIEHEAAATFEKTKKIDVPETFTFEELNLLYRRTPAVSRPAFLAKLITKITK